MTASVLVPALADLGGILSGVGVGGLVGALANHLLAKRRESNKEERDRADREQQEDGKQALALAAVLRELRKVIGDSSSPYVQDTWSTDWGEPERARAAELLAALERTAGELESVRLALHDPTLGLSVTSAHGLFVFACGALREDRPSPAAHLVEQAVTDMEGDVEAFLKGRRAPSGDLQSALYDEIRDSIGAEHEDRSRSAMLYRVRDRWFERIERNRP